MYNPSIASTHSDLHSPYVPFHIQLSQGSITRFERFPSQYVQPRNVDVWLPVNYSHSKKYAVLYMHDGQMLFDAATTWNNQSWNVHETITSLVSCGKIKDTIVVGVWNNGEHRHAEYYPQKSLQYLNEDTRNKVVTGLLKGHAQADNYLKFLVDELKPFIDHHFSTSTTANDTFIAGSSMGGLISLYALCEYPKVFKSAACLSTHWPGYTSLNTNSIPSSFIHYLHHHLPSPANHFIYFDRGTDGLDSMYRPWQTRVDDVMRSKGYDEISWMTKEFAGDNHSENSWSRRLHIPLQFLLKHEERFQHEYVMQDEFRYAV